MVMEAFQGYENRIQYDIVGHSGESESIIFVNKNNPPIDNKQRLEVIKVNSLDILTVLVLLETVFRINFFRISIVQILLMTLFHEDLP